MLHLAARPLAKLVLPYGQWPCLVAFLKDRFKGLTEEAILQRLGDGEIFYQADKILPPDAPYVVGQVLFYRRHLQPEAKVPGEIGIVYEDDHILVADKPPFMAVLPAGNHFEESLTVRLRRRTGNAQLTPAHRIDRDTMGLVLFTKQAAVRGAYQGLFERQQLEKFYEAIAPRRPELKFPLLAEHFLAEHPSAFMQMQVHPDKLPNARCQIWMIEYKGEWARYRVRLITGRKHQIRAQFCALGMPIVNDRIYPALQAHAPGDFNDPLQLLANSLSFSDPLTKRSMLFESARKLDW